MDIYIEIFAYLYEINLSKAEDKRQLILEINKETVKHTHKDLEFIPNIL